MAGSNHSAAAGERRASTSVRSGEEVKRTLVSPVLAYSTTGGIYRQQIPIRHDTYDIRAESDLSLSFVSHASRREGEAANSKTECSCDTFYTFGRSNCRFETGAPDEIHVVVNP